MEKKPIYLYITPFFPSASRWQGGFCFDAVTALMNIPRYKVIVVLVGDSSDDYSYNGITVHCVKRVKLPFDVAPYLFMGINGRKLLKKLESIGIDISEVSLCHSNMMPEYSYFFKKANPHVVAFWQTHWSGAPFRVSFPRLGYVPILSDAMYMFYRKMFSRIDFQVLLSRKHAQEFGFCYEDGQLNCLQDIRRKLILGRFLKKIPLGKYYVLYNGINTEIFHPSNKAKKNNGFVIGCVGNFHRTKGQLILLKSLLRLKNIEGLRCIFVGTGPELSCCKDYAHVNRLDDIVEFREEVDHNNLPDIYRLFDLFVLPSVQEGFCCVLIEAAGCGVPVIATKAISFGEVLPNEDKAFWLAEPYDEKDLADKILGYYNHRYTFRFNQEMDINLLYRDFLDSIDKWHL